MRAVAALREHPEIGQYTFAFNSPWAHCQPQPDKGLQRVPWLEPTAAIYSFDALEAMNFQVGPDEWTMGWGCEYLQAYQLQKAGLTRVVDSYLEMRHETSTTMAATMGREAYYQAAAKQCTEMIRKHLPPDWWQVVGCEVDPWQEAWQEPTKHEIDE
jgi:hypothetical protein